jgi:methyl-accepting chemotaxis protein
MPIQTRIWLGFVLCLLTLLLVVVAGYRATQFALEKSSWVDHTYEVASLIDTAETQFKDAETGQRGYLLTGDPSYLEPYENGTASVASILSRARNLTSDNPSQQQRVDQLEMLSSAKLFELKETIDYYDAGNRDKAFEVVLTDRGKNVMDDIRALIQEMKAEEETLLVLRKQESLSAAHKVTYIATLGGIVMLSGLLVAIAAFFRGNTRRYLIEHNQVEQELRNEIAQLEQSLSETRAVTDTINLCPNCMASKSPR